ncbi:MAG TPA: lipopolysaccharide biosynthesis protein [Terriglobales bacterium]|nr:lipopolysaccharide biosynthesis protein [Terriglobales bacterium]
MQSEPQPVDSQRAPLVRATASSEGRRRRFPALVHDTATTMIAEALVLVGGLLFYGIAARYFDPTGVGVLVLVKRAGGLLTPAVFLGLQTGLPRCIAQARAIGSDPSPLVLAGSAILAVALTVALLPVLLLPGATTRALMGLDMPVLAVPLAFTLASVIVYGAVRGFYFGLLRIPRANLVQVAAVAVAPIIALVVWHPSPAAAVAAAGLATMLVAVAGGLPLLGVAGRPRPAAELRSAGLELLRYSTPRMPGDLAIAALMSVGTLWAARFADLHTVGYLSISQSLLSAVTAAFIPLSAVILPRAAALVVAGQADQIRTRLRLLVRLTLIGSVFVTLQGVVFADTVLYWWLGPQFSSGAAVLRLVLAGVPFLALFFSLRSLVDAASATPYHTYNLFAALGVMAAGLVVSSVALPAGLRPLGIAASGSVALIVLAVLTVRVCGRLYEVPLRLGGSAGALGICAIAAAVAGLVHLRVSGTSPLGLIALVGLEVALFAIAVLPAFAGPLRQVLRPRRSVR